MNNLLSIKTFQWRKESLSTNVAKKLDVHMPKSGDFNPYFTPCTKLTQNGSQTYSNPEIIKFPEENKRKTFVTLG